MLARWATRRLLIPVLCAVVLAEQPAAADDVAAPVDATRRAVQALRAQVDAVGAELAAAAVAYEQGQDRLDRLRQLEFASAVDVEVRARQVQEAQRRVDGLARSVYQGPVDPALAAWLRGDLQAIGDLAYVRERIDSVAGEQRAAVQVLTEAASAAEDVGQQRRAAREEGQRLQSQLDGELNSLRELADARHSELAAAQVAMLQAEAAEAVRVIEARRREAAARLAAEQAVRSAGSARSTTAACAGPVEDVVNGFLPPGALCALSVPGHALAFHAAPAFEAMSAAYAQQFGSPLCVTDSYRDYAGQLDVFRRKPALAATPGRSQHGWGLAVDLCGGVESFGTAPHQWMQKNAGRFGFVHPAWARPDGSRPEPWHWEFRAEGLRPSR